MPFCPNCKVEYRKGFTQCNDCMVGLVDQLPEEPSKAPAAPAEVAPAVTEEFAELAADMHPDEFLHTLNVLEDHSIPVISSDVSSHTALFHNFIKVPVSRFDEATELLKKFKFERVSGASPDDNVLSAAAEHTALEETGSGVNPMIILGIMAGIVLLFLLLKYMQSQ